MGLLGLLRGRRGRMPPLLKLLLGLVAYHSLTRGKGRLAAVIGAGLGRAGGLGGLFAGGAGGALLGGALQHVLDALRDNGRSGPIAAADVEEALGEERIQWLMRQTGMSRAALIAGLSKARWKP